MVRYDVIDVFNENDVALQISEIFYQGAVSAWSEDEIPIEIVKWLILLVNRDGVR
jgi:hypothetical protein